jgi:phosphatidyl-myo-inositol alpha-mannosyltransferase
MRIALVCPYDLSIPGGVQAHVLALADRLRRGGDEVRVVGPSSTDPARSDDVVAVGRSVGVRFNRSVAPVALDPRAARSTLRALRGLEPDVIHVHEPAVPVVSLAATLRAPRPIVATFHAWSDRDRAYRAARPLLRPTLRRIDRRIAVSPPAARHHAGALGLPVGSFRVVPNGVDTARFRDAAALPELTAHPGPVLLFVGRLEPRKGLEHLLRAHRMLRSDRPDAHLVVVGDGPERQSCERLLGADDRASVTFVGQVQPGALPRYHASADVFVAPALGGESFGIVLLEAMAAGVAVVASDIPGYRSVVDDGRDGVLVPPGRAGSLTGALRGLLADPERRAALVAAGHRTADEHDWSVVAGRIREIYAEVATGGA